MKKTTLFYTFIIMLTVCLFCISCSEEKKAEEKQINIDDYMQFGFYSDSEIDTETEIAYKLYIPESYEEKKEYSLLIFLHAAPERGNNDKYLYNKDQAKYIYRILEDEELKERFIIFAPRCPEEMMWVDSSWESGTYDFESTSQSIPEALTMSYIEKELLTKYSVDMSKIYVTGLSIGGFGTWDLLARYPDFFAAGLSICGGCDIKTAETVKDIPIRVFHSDDDTNVSIEGEIAMCEEINKLGGDAEITVLNGVGHMAWLEGYSDDETFNWFINQTKITD